MTRENSGVGLGGHYGWLAVGPSRRVESRALALVSGRRSPAGSSSAAKRTSDRRWRDWAAVAWEIGAGIGVDDPNDADLAPAGQRLRNLALEDHATWRRAPIVLGAEVRLLRTRHGAGLGTMKTAHFNLAAGFEF